MRADPFPQYDQVFVILRVDTASARERSPEAALALVKALWSAAAAEAEVVRLNQAGHDTGSVYFWKATRLERRFAQAGTR